MNRYVVSNEPLDLQEGVLEWRELQCGVLVPPLTITRVPV
jgi:hypothetical protein